jgi:hypothetical protein
MRFAGIKGEPPVDHAGTVRLSANHTVTGNPDRLHRGKVRISADERWRAELGAREVIAATLPAWPLLARYGYGFTDGRVG